MAYNTDRSAAGGSQEKESLCKQGQSARQFRRIPHSSAVPAYTIGLRPPTTLFGTILRVSDETLDALAVITPLKNTVNIEYIDILGKLKVVAGAQ